MLRLVLSLSSVHQLIEFPLPSGHLTLTETQNPVSPDSLTQTRATELRSWSEPICFHSLAVAVLWVFAYKEEVGYRSCITF